jgi:hypothetical protein
MSLGAAALQPTATQESVATMSDCMEFGTSPPIGSSTKTNEFGGATRIEVVIIVLPAAVGGQYRDLVADYS